LRPFAHEAAPFSPRTKQEDQEELRQKENEDMTKTGRVVRREKTTVERVWRAWRRRRRWRR
jgi:hypothetical protein